jgi:4-hydroxy-tetrahydrodipicolinate reductase
MIDLVVVGARGRLGSLVVAEAAKRPADFKIRAQLGRGDALDFAGASAVIDVSNASATASIALACSKARVPLVVGTTGLDAAALAALDDAARSIAVLHAANFSVSAHVAAVLARVAADPLREYDVEVVEVHHKKKQDAPSGTALMLATAAAEGRDQDLVLKRGRDGLSPRSTGEIGVSAVRGGDVVGEHTVYFLGDGERIEIVHRVTDRAVFARGALAAAAFLVGKKPGRYAMADVISK